MTIEETVHIGRGAIIVENPCKDVRDGLRRFVHKCTGGEYENLYTLSNGGRVLATLPGYANRVKRLCRDAKIIDERLKMPAPMVEAALVGMEPWENAIKKSVCACGGVISVPDIIGFAKTAAAILRAFPRDALMDRGTALSVVAVSAPGFARAVANELERMLPEREVGLLTGSKCSESEDIIVSTYDSMIDVQVQYAGVLVGEVPTHHFSKKAGRLSAIRSAARFGIASSSFGGDVEFDMVVEGMFGPLVSSISYDEVVKAGIGTPITVVWVPSPKPKEYIGSAPFSVLSDTAMQRNKEFVTLIADIMKYVPNDIGCIVCTDDKIMAERVKTLVPSAVEVVASPQKERCAILGDIAGGTIRKAIASTGCFPHEISHGVMVVANCTGWDMTGWSIPWRHLTKPGEKTYLVDFRHDWDRHNGRPGRLALNDAARMRRYMDMGFSQISVSNAAQLPF